MLVIYLLIEGVVIIIIVFYIRVSFSMVEGDAGLLIRNEVSVH